MTRKTYLRSLARISAGVAVIYLVLVAFTWAFQRDLLYRPRSQYLTPQEAGLAGVVEVALRTDDGIRVLAWHAPAPEGAPTLVYFHGNGGALAMFRGLVRRLQGAGYGALLVSYRGYPGSEGSPSEEGLYADGRAALGWLLGQGVPGEQIFLYGHSLGSGVVVKLASERKVRGLILEAPYTSTVDVASIALPVLPVTWLMRDRFESLSRIKDVHVPVLVMHGAADAVIPQRLGRQLFDAANEPKIGYFPEHANHNDLHLHDGWKQIVSFVESHRYKIKGRQAL